MQRLLLLRLLLQVRSDALTVLGMTQSPHRTLMLQYAAVVQTPQHRGLLCRVAMGRQTVSWGLWHVLAAASRSLGMGEVKGLSKAHVARRLPGLQ